MPSSTMFRAALLCLAAIACGGKPPADEPPSSAGAAAAPTSPAGSIAGCNRFSGAYTLNGDSLGFGPMMSTKMACADGDKLERSFLAALPRVTTYTVADSTLTLGTADGPLLRFVAQ